MIGSALLAMEQGISPAYIAVGAAAGLHRYLNENNTEQSAQNALQVLQEVSGLQPDSTLTQMILSYYKNICQGATLDVLCAMADEVKRSSLEPVV